MFIGFVSSEPHRYSVKLCKRSKYWQWTTESDAPVFVNGHSMHGITLLRPSS